jgi:hypothetical protein
LLLGVALGLLGSGLRIVSRLYYGSLGSERTLGLDYQRWGLFNVANSFACLDLNVIFRNDNLLAGNDLIFVLRIDSPLLALIVL